MILPKPPIESLVDSFVYKEFVSDDGSWGKPEYKAPATIENCRIDRGSQYSSSSSGKTLLFNGLIFCYNGLTTPLPTFKEQSVVIYDEQEHVITKVVTVTEAYSSDVYSFELEVV